MGKSISEMNSLVEAREYLITKAGEDSEFRASPAPGSEGCDRE